MTINGGQPHKVGDLGQRYEVSFEDGNLARRVLGWTDSLDDAESMVTAITLHPSWHSPKIKDRRPD